MSDIIKEYDLVFEDSITELKDKVNEMIKQGWRPQGGVCTSVNMGVGVLFCQAMIKG